MRIGQIASAAGRVAVCALVALVLATVGTARADELDPDSFRALDIGDGRVTFDVQEAVFGQVVAERIQPRTRANIFVSPEAADLRVTLRVVDLHWTQALDALAEKVNANIVRRSTNLLRIERPEPVTFSFTDEDIRTVITTIAGYAEADVILSPKVTGTITLSLSDTPWREALEQVARTLGFAVVEENYGILRVVPLDELDLQTDYYRFRYLQPPAPYKGVIATQAQGGGSGGGGGGGGGSGGSTGADIIVSDVFVPSDDPTQVEANFPVIEALRQIVSPEGGNVRYIVAQNTIIFTGTSPKIAAVKDMLRELDIEPPQVFIDMNFVVTTNSDALDLGLQGGNNGLAASFSGADILHQLPFNVGGGTGDLADAITGTAFPSPAGSAFGFGTLNFSQTQLLFTMLQRDTSTNIVQAPKLLALDNQEATIFIGESIRYARTTAATNQNGGLTFAVEEDPNSPVNVGFQLLVIPHVIPGEDKIMLLVIPQRRELSGTTSPIPGFDRISIAGQEIDLPRVQSSTLKTAMILRNGQTAVIGGMLEDVDRKSVDKIPLLGDIPLLGLMFQGKSTIKAREHLIITITPRILDDTDAANCLISDELSGQAARAQTEWTDMHARSAGAFPGDPCPPLTPCSPCGGFPPPNPEAPCAPPPVRAAAPPPAPPPPAGPVIIAPGR
jgi:type II secretory pathway component GspD/PulD (secretin)